MYVKTWATINISLLLYVYLVIVNSGPRAWFFYLPNALHRHLNLKFLQGLYNRFSDAKPTVNNYNIILKLYIMQK